MKCRGGGCRGNDKMTETMTTKMTTIVSSWGIWQSTNEGGNGMQGVESGESYCHCIGWGNNNNDDNDSNVVRRRTVVSTMWPQPHLHVNRSGNHGNKVAHTTTPNDHNNRCDRRASRHCVTVVQFGGGWQKRYTWLEGRGVAAAVGGYWLRWWQQSKFTTSYYLALLLRTSSWSGCRGMREMGSGWQWRQQWWGRQEDVGNKPGLGQQGTLLMKRMR